MSVSVVSNLKCKKGVNQIIKYFFFVLAFLGTGTLLSFGFVQIEWSNPSTYHQLTGFSFHKTILPIPPQCRPPPLEAFNHDAKKNDGQIKEDCSKYFNKQNPGIVFEMRNGNVLLRLKTLKTNVPCCYRSFYRNGDDKVRLEPTCHPIQDKVNVTVIPSHIEFIEVLCKNIYRDAFAIAHDNIKRFPPSSTARSLNSSSSHTPLNVVIICLDSTSRLNFLRKMPLSNDYLLNKLDAQPLLGYSVVGEGSLKNIVPLLTGLSSTQFNRTCAHTHLDQCPFIWHEFSRIGHLTTFANDWTIFNSWFPNAFKNPPTDYYFRPYLQHMANFAGDRNSHFCFGPRLAFQVSLNFVEATLEKAYKLNRPSFQFSLSARLAHEYMYGLALGDVPLLQTLTRFQTSGQLNNTVLIVMGDHGIFRKPYIFTTSGKMEYKLPLAYIVLPTWFKTRHSEMYKNLQENTRRMTTPYDMHETLKDIVSLGQRKEEKGSAKNPGISLFQPIPENRKCVEAGILLKWCTMCFPTIAMDTSEPIALAAAKYIMDKINNYTKDHRGLCQEQQMYNLTKVYRMDERDFSREICNVSGENENADTQLELTPKFMNVSCGENDLRLVVTVELISVQKAEYMGQVMISGTNNHNSDSVEIRLMDKVARFDNYWVASGCMADKSLKKYCICK